MERWRYNEFAAERCADDMAAMLHQQKRVAKFDKMIKGRRSQLPRVGMVTVSAEALEQPVAVVETEQPKNYQGDEFEGVDTRDWSALAKDSL